MAARLFRAWPFKLKSFVSLSHLTSLVWFIHDNNNINLGVQQVKIVIWGQFCYIRTILFCYLMRWNKIMNNIIGKHKLKLSAVGLALGLGALCWFQPINLTAKAEASAYHGNIKSAVYHTKDCRYYNCKSCTQPFQSIEEAHQSGYRACNVCL